MATVGRSRPHSVAWQVNAGFMERFPRNVNPARFQTETLPLRIQIAVAGPGFTSLET